MLNKAVNFLKENSNKKVMIIFDTDGDGIGAAVIFTKTLKTLFKLPKAMPATHSLLFLNKKLLQEIEKKNFDLIIILDIAADEKPEYILKISKRSKILIIDHHQPQKNLNKHKNILHINPSFWKIKIPSYKYCTSKIAFDICKKLGIEGLDWLAGIGIVNDKCEDVWKNFLKGICKKYKISLKKMELINKIITSSYYYFGIKGMNISYKACLEASSPSNFLMLKTANLKKLKNFYDSIEREIKSVMKNWKKEAKIFENKKLIILKLKTKFNISSPISTKISLEKPNYTIIVARKKGKIIYMSLRRQDKKINCGKIAKLATEGLENSSGGGHKPAAGIHIMSKDWNVFKRRILNLL